MKIAIIDEGIDINKLLHPANIKKVISLTDKAQFNTLPEGNHGTKCAQLLEACASDYELLDIRAALNWRTPVSVCCIKEALECCITEGVDIICLSAGTVCLSEAKVLNQTIKKLEEHGIILVTSLSNFGHLTLPGAYPHAVCAAMDWNGLLSPAGCALAEHRILGRLMISNIQLPPNHLQEWQGNSYAVPVAAGWILSQIQESGIHDIYKLLEKLPYLSSGFEKKNWGIPAENPCVAVITEEVSVQETVRLLNGLLKRERLEAAAVIEEYCGNDFRILGRKNHRTSRKKLIADIDSYVDCSLILSVYRKEEWTQEDFSFDLELYWGDMEVQVYADGKYYSSIQCFNSEKMLDEICKKIIDLLS